MEISKESQEYADKIFSAANEIIRDKHVYYGDATFGAVMKSLMEILKETNPFVPESKSTGLNPWQKK